MATVTELYIGRRENGRGGRKSHGAKGEQFPQKIASAPFCSTAPTCWERQRGPEEGQEDADELKKGAEEGKREGNELTTPLKEDADELKKGAEEGKREGNELTAPLKEDADEFKNEWKKEAEEGERDLDDAQKDANNRVCIACCCETTLHRSATPRTLGSQANRAKVP